MAGLAVHWQKPWCVSVWQLVAERKGWEKTARSAVCIYVSCSNWILNLFQIFWIEMYWRINMFDNTSVWCLTTWLIKCITVTWSHQWWSRSVAVIRDVLSQYHCMTLLTEKCCFLCTISHSWCSFIPDWFLVHSKYHKKPNPLYKTSRNCKSTQT